MRKLWNRFLGFVSYHRDVLISIGFLALILITIGSMYLIGKA